MITIKLKNETRLVPKGSTLLCYYRMNKRKSSLCFGQRPGQRIEFQISFDAEVEFWILDPFGSRQAYEAVCAMSSP